MKMEYAVFGTEVVPKSDLRIPVDHPGFLFGYGVYEVLPVVNGCIIDWEAHFGRIVRSAELLDFSLPPESSSWKDAAGELVNKNKVVRGRLKIHVLGGLEPVVYMLTLPPWELPPDGIDEGVACISFHGHRFLPEVKSTSLLVNYMAGKKAEQHGSFEALLVDALGNVTEGSRTNVFLFTHDRIITPDRDILRGITRDAVLTAATELGFTLEFRCLPLTELHEAAFDCLGISSSSIGLVPVRSLDDRPLPVRRTRLMKVRELMQSI